MSKTCPLLSVCRGLEACLHILPLILDFLWHELLSDFPFFMACSFWGLGFAWLWVFLPSAHSFTLFCSLATISCHTALLFLLWCYLTQTCKASLGLLLILLPMTPYDHWAFYYIACGLLCSIYFLLASLAHLLSLGILGPFSNSAFPWAITNSFGLPWPNYFILHLWGSWTFHQPLSLLALLRAYCDPFSLFYITYYPWVCYFSLSRLL